MAEVSCSYSNCPKPGIYLCKCIMPGVIFCDSHIKDHFLKVNFTLTHNLNHLDPPKPQMLDEDSKKIIASHMKSTNTDISTKIKALILKTTTKFAEVNKQLGLLIERNRISTENYNEIINFIFRYSLFPEPYKYLNTELISNKRDCKIFIENTKFGFYESVYKEIQKYETFIANFEQIWHSDFENTSQIIIQNSLTNNLIEKSPENTIHTPDSMKTELEKEHLLQENKKLLEEISRLGGRINEFEDFKIKHRDFELQKANEAQKFNKEIEDLKNENTLKDELNQSLKKKLEEYKKELKLRDNNKEEFKKKVEERLKDTIEANTQKSIEKPKISETTENWNSKVNNEPPMTTNKPHTNERRDSSNEKARKSLSPHMAREQRNEAEAPKSHSHSRSREKSYTTDKLGSKNEGPIKISNSKWSEDVWNEAESSRKHSHSRSREKSNTTDRSDHKSEKPIMLSNSKRLEDEDPWKEVEAPQNHSHSQSREKAHTTDRLESKNEEPMMLDNPKWVEDAWHEAESSQRHSHSRSKEKSHTTNRLNSRNEESMMLENSKWAEDAWNEAESSQRHSHSRSKEKSYKTDRWDSRNENSNKYKNSYRRDDTEANIPKKHSKSRSNERYDSHENPRKIPKLNNYEFKCKSIFKGAKTAYFKDKTKILRTKNLDELKETEVITQSEDHELSDLPEPIYTYIAMCQIPSGAIFCYGNLHNGYATGITFIIDKDFSLTMKEYGKPCFNSSVCYYEGSIYAFGGSNDKGKTNEASKFIFNSNNWSNIADLPDVSNFCTTLAYENKIYIAGHSFSKIYIYDPQDDSYGIAEENLKIGSPKLLLSIYDKIYLLQSKGDLLVYDGRRWSRSRNSAELFVKNPSSYRIIYKSQIYFTCGDAEYYKFSSHGDLGFAFSWY